jgi:bis(5'-nucleosyl)-tetraphosphatase (symmetrical)
MATYVIGDVHGCYEGLMRLLARIDYSSNTDTLWFCGDLINRGTASLQTLNWIRNQRNCHSILGNHDLHALALAHGAFPDNKAHTLHDLMGAPNRIDVLEWLRHTPLMHYDPAQNFCLVHAGIYPCWTLSEACGYTKEAELVLQSEALPELLKHMYGNHPARWSDALTGHDRLRFIMNATTRMRYVSDEDALEFKYVAAPGNQPSGLWPWYERPHHRQETLVCFGHWSSLRGSVNQPYLQGLDGGFVWGGELLAYQLENQTRTGIANI